MNEILSEDPAAGHTTDPFDLEETVPDWTENLVETVYFETVDDSFCFEHYFETLTMSVAVKLAVHVCTNSCLESDTDYPCNIGRN